MPKVRAVFIIAGMASSISLTVVAQNLQQPVDAKVPATTAPKWLTEETPGQWRASKLIGLNVYNNDNEKIGSITELIVDGSGQLDAVVVAAGGFLGLGEHDVAVPYGDVKWMYLPGLPSPANPPSGPATTVEQNVKGAHPSADKAFAEASSARSYPDHAIIEITKEQLKTAPSFKFLR